MKNAKYSIVIPVYNRASIIEPTIRSVLNQSFQDFEVVIVDDGSSDDLRSVIDAIGDPRIVYVHQPNAGGGAARNRGIQSASGEYIALLDSDDLFQHDKLEVYDQNIQSDPDKVFYSSMRVDRGGGNYWIRPDRGIAPGEDVGEYLFCANQLIQTSTLVLKKTIAERTLFNPSLRRGQDLDFCVRLQRDGAEFKYVDAPLTVWSDNVEVGRTSYVNGVAASSEWLALAGPLLSTKAKLGYKATVLAYHLAKVQKLTALQYIFDGWLRGGVPTKVALRQVLRAYMPRTVYRKVVNRFVNQFGIPKT